MRRKLLILCIVWLISLSGMAQSLPKMSFQAVVRNANNELITNASVSVTVSFINFSPSGTVVYSEAHNVRSNQNGLISLLVGDGSVLSGSMEEIIWNDTYIKTEITADGYTVTDTKPATAVPIALYGENIPLQALQEHLGSTDLVSGEELRDTLSNYMTQEAAQNYFDNNNNVTADRLYDTLRYYVMTQAMSSTLQNISEQLSDLQSIKNKVDEFTIPSSPNNTFTLTYSPLTEREVLMYINGIFVSPSAFTYSANQLIYIPTNNGNKTLVANDRIQIYYYYQR